MSAVLGPLPLDQLPKSKPVTPMLSCLVSPGTTVFQTAVDPSLHYLFTLQAQQAVANQDSRRRRDESRRCRDESRRVRARECPRGR